MKTMKPEIFNDSDVQIDTYSNISGFNIRATHRPTGFVEVVRGDKSSSRIGKTKEVIFNLKIRVIVDYFSKILLIDFKEKSDRLKIVADAINELVTEGVEFEKAVKIMVNKTDVNMKIYGVGIADDFIMRFAFYDRDMAMSYAIEKAKELRIGRIRDRDGNTLWGDPDDLLSLVLLELELVKKMEEDQ